MAPEPYHGAFRTLIEAFLDEWATHIACVPLGPIGTRVMDDELIRIANAIANARAGRKA